jgi:hypothetical protein
MALAVFRAWRLVAEDTILDGPRAWILNLPRSWEEGDPLPPGYREWIGNLIICPWCLGFWFSGIATAVWAWLDDWPGIVNFGGTWLALSGAVGLIAHYYEQDDE